MTESATKKLWQRLVSWAKACVRTRTAPAYRATELTEEEAEAFDELLRDYPLYEAYRENARRGKKAVPAGPEAES